MNVEGIVRNFEHIASAPHGVRRLRELLLHLAVSGRLVPKLFGEGDGDDAISEAMSLKQAYRAKLGLRSGTPARPLRSEELMFDIPHHWKWERLGNVACYVQRGKGPRYDTSGKLRIVSQKCVQWSGFDFTVARHASDDSIANYSQERFLAKGDVLWNSTGTGTVGRLVVYPGEKGQVVVDSHVTIVRLTNFVPEYVWCFLASPIVQQRMLPGQANSMVSGTTNQVELSTSQVLDVSLPCPPIAEQKRIALKVEELMTLCNELESREFERQRQFPVLSRVCHAAFVSKPTQLGLNRIFDEIDTVSAVDFRRTIFELAIQGKLTRQSKSDEPGQRLLSTLEAERRLFAEAHKFRGPAPAPVSSSLVPFSIPSGWSWVRLSTLFNAITDGDHLPPPRANTGVAFLTIGNISSGTLDFAETRFVPDSYYRGLAEFRRPRRGDILYTVVGATYGRPALVDTERPFCVQRHIAILKPAECIELRYLMVLLRSSLVYEQAASGITGTAQPTIPLGALRNFLVPLPPRAEQRRIVDRVDDLVASVDRMAEQQQERDIAAGTIANAFVVSLTGANADKGEGMKAPKTELVSVVKIGKKQDSRTRAPLAALLKNHNGELAAKSLWEQSGLAIDAFYEQLKTEITQGLVAPPVEAEMKIVEEA